MDVLQPQKIIHSQLFGSVIKPAGAHVDSTPPVTEGVTLDVHADPYQQAMEYAEQFGQPTNHTYFREESVNPSLDKIKGKMQAAMREFNHSEDLVHALSRKKRSLPVTVEDGRAHIHALNDVINNIHSGYQKQYGELVKSATKFMQEINTAIGNISKHMKPGSDGKINFYGKQALLEIDKIVEGYSGKGFYKDPDYVPDLESYFNNWSADIQNSKPILQLANTGGVYAFWDKKLSGQGFIVKASGGEINIYPDLKPITEIYSTIKNISIHWGQGNMMAQEFQSMQTAIDSQKNAVNNSVSRLLENFRQDNSHFETLTQLLIQLIKDLGQNNNALINI